MLLSNDYLPFGLFGKRQPKVSTVNMSERNDTMRLVVVDMAESGASAFSIVKVHRGGSLYCEACHSSSQVTGSSKKGLKCGHVQHIKRFATNEESEFTYLGRASCRHDDVDSGSGLEAGSVLQAVKDIVAFKAEPKKPHFDSKNQIYDFESLSRRLEKKNETAHSFVAREPVELYVEDMVCGSGDQSILRGM